MRPTNSLIWQILLAEEVTMMIGALWRGASGMRAQQVQVDSLANDIANVNTTGYKQARVGFSDLVYRPVMEAGMPVEQPQAPGSTVSLGTGVKVASIVKDFSQGALVQTGEPLNLAIQGEGFFAVVNGAGERFLTRDGNFHRDANGNVVNDGGYYLAIPAGNNQDVPLNLPPEAENINVAADGTITATVNGQVQPLGQIYLYTVSNPAGLEAVGDNLYRLTPACGQLFYGAPGTAGNSETTGTPGPVLGTLRSGYLEAANVDLAATMTRMVVAQRAYELNSRTIRVADEMWSLANNLRR